MLCCECPNRVHPGGDKSKNYCLSFKKEIIINFDAAAYFMNIDGELHVITSCENRPVIPIRKFRRGYHE